MGINSLPLFVPIKGVKKLLIIDKKKRMAYRAADISAFWDVAQEVAELWGKVDVSI